MWLYVYNLKEKEKKLELQHSLSLQYIRSEANEYGLEYTF